jgi:hypothetical protein
VPENDVTTLNVGRNLPAASVAQDTDEALHWQQAMPANVNAAKKRYPVLHFLPAHPVKKSAQWSRKSILGILDQI